MRKVILLTVVLVMLPLAARAQRTAIRPTPVDEPTRQALFTARDAVWRAWFAGDSAALGRLLPAALAACGRGGWETRDASIASARSFAASGGKLVELRFDSTSIALQGAVAVLVAKYHLVVATGSDRSTRDGTATEIFVRRGDGWVNPFWYLQ